MPFNLPILLTWLRIVAIPLLIAVYFLPAGWATPHERDFAATWLFVAAAFTDWADGYLARKLDQTSAFGAFLDPVADKLMVAAALIILVQLGRTDAIVATIIIGREITISALREWMAKIGAAKSVAVSMLGKIKTAAQMTAIPLLLYSAPLFGFDVRIIGNWLIWIAALLTLWSMGYYLRMAWPEIAKRSAEKQ
ncbi:CDP-diacylglycerol--glycerol-3-phosphate 3-phosphatidyltransferase [Dechloromonas sp. A34]|uniref:CDP-diacylglycerol--glycerol-3-phosphate 3-phosphatidyltransferase n=1 Tax=Dechloromonas sp. A34 TaxID=447588 RepID=UPI0022489692|nr:CDP-diacylglycerol--glycerol-3-phosphate 3-phosphatidyltransferase [Dechloromonas sp. A34]